MSHDSATRTRYAIPPASPLWSTHSSTTETELQADTCFAVLAISPDRFTRVNGAIGFRLGDEMLALLRGRIAATLSLSDLLLHVAGDVFAVILFTNPAAGLEQLIWRMQELLHRTYVVQGQVVQLTVSIGAAVGNDDQTSKATLSNAILALKVAKAKGVAEIALFGQEMQDKEHVNQRLSMDMPKALVAGHFHLHLHPQVDLQSQTLVGNEATLCWEHPELGPVAASSFYPLAEEVGFIESLGEWALQKVCRKSAFLPHGTTVTLNAVHSQLVKPGFVGTVRRVVESSRCSASRLVIAVTETGLFDDRRSVCALAELRDLGIKIAIDDFGTGIFSFRSFADLPCDIVKLHASILGSSNKQRVVVRAITSLARDLGLLTIAAGISTKQQAAQAQEDGCEVGQGTFFDTAPDRPATGHF